MASSLASVIGLIPSAGLGSRISPLPMSKELYPVGLDLTSGNALRLKLAAEYLLERMVVAGIREAFVILRPGKWDIPAYFGDGSSVAVRLAYLTVHVPYGVPFTLNQALPFVRDSTIALGFPDILFWPENAYDVVLQRLDQSLADVVLGLFPTAEPTQVGLVELDRRGRVLGIHEKSDITHLRFMWAIAVWRPSFSRFLHDFVENELQCLAAGNSTGMPGTGAHPPEYPIGDVIHAAIEAGLIVEAETFERGRYIDIGTPRNLIKAVQQELGAANPWID
jgi:glucose-1-phosphate thymidylyltransferase